MEEYVVECRLKLRAIFIQFLIFMMQPRKATSVFFLLFLRGASLYD
jgi:hypothetical protein